MMKKTVDLALEMGVDLRGVLTWAFTFPGTPYFAGYRALSTNGIHLPVLNAFKLLGSMSGNRLPLASSGARSLADVLQSGVRAESDVDGLAAIDGDRIQVLVWNYHDDLIDAEAAPVTLHVAIPASFGGRVAMTHTRVDQTHGDAFSVWVAQGSPATPSAEQLEALREAMVPVVLEPERALAVTNGAVSLSFELPRFGISLLTFAPADAENPNPRPPSDGGCSCRMRSSSRPPTSSLIALALAVAVACRRFSTRERRWFGPRINMNERC